MGNEVDYNRLDNFPIDKDWSVLTVCTLFMVVLIIWVIVDRVKGRNDILISGGFALICAIVVSITIYVINNHLDIIWLVSLISVNIGVYAYSIYNLFVIKVNVSKLNKVVDKHES